MSPIGPNESSVVDSGTAPPVGIRLAVGLKPVRPAQRGRDADRPAGVGAERDGRHPVGHGGRRAGRRAAGDPRVARDVAAVRRARRAEMRVQAEAGKREFAHVGAAHQHRAGPPEPRDGGRIGLRGRRAVEHARAGAGHLARDVEQILHRHRDAGERRQHGARGAQPVVRRRPCARGRHRLR
jgi:hypothetical protein